MKLNNIFLLFICTSAAASDHSDGSTTQSSSGEEPKLPITGLHIQRTNKSAKKISSTDASLDNRPSNRILRPTSSCTNISKRYREETQSAKRAFAQRYPLFHTIDKFFTEHDKQIEVLAQHMRDRNHFPLEYPLKSAQEAKNDIIISNLLKTSADEIKKYDIKQDDGELLSWSQLVEQSIHELRDGFEAKNYALFNAALEKILESWRPFNIIINKCTENPNMQQLLYLCAHWPATLTNLLTEWSLVSENTQNLENTKKIIQEQITNHNFLVPEIMLTCAQENMKCGNRKTALECYNGASFFMPHVKKAYTCDKKARLTYDKYIRIGHELLTNNQY